MTRHRLWLCVVSLLVAGPLAAQQVASGTPQEWQADARANKRAQKAAEKAAKAAMPPRKGGEAGPPGGGNPPGSMDGPGGPGGGQGPGGPGGGQGPGGEGGPPPGGKGGPGPSGGHSPVTAEVMLRPEMDFAAPVEETLVLYRSRDAVIFGSKESQNVVILPLSGQSVSIAPGVTASVHDQGGELRLDMTTSNEIHVTNHYLIQGDVLKVAVHAEGPFPRPGSHFDVERTYHVSQPAR